MKAYAIRVKNHTTGYAETVKVFTDKESRDQYFNEYLSALDNSKCNVITTKSSRIKVELVERTDNMATIRTVRTTFDKVGNESSVETVHTYKMVELGLREYKAKL